MKPKLTSKIAWDRALAKHGLKDAELDDPIYSEGPSIILSFHTPRPSEQKIISSLLNDSPSDSEATGDEN
jgi:hypothetical protein